MRFLTVGLLLVSSAALGQTTFTLTVDNVTDNTQPIGLNREDCGRDLDVIWTVSGVTPCEAMELWVTQSNSCSDDGPGTADLVLDSVPRDQIVTRGTTERQISVNGLPLFTAADGGACGSGEVEKEMRVCGLFRVADAVGSCNTEIKVSTAPRLRFDTKPPPKPTITSVVGRDSALSVEVDAEDNSTIRVVARRTDADGGTTDVASDDTTATEGTATLEGLVNGVTYNVVAVATDQADNPSLESDPVTGTPVASSGFFDEYVDAGGKETGGCGAAGGGIAGGAVLAALGFWLSRRKQS